MSAIPGVCYGGMRGGGLPLALCEAALRFCELLICRLQMWQQVCPTALQLHPCLLIPINECTLWTAAPGILGAHAAAWQSATSRRTSVMSAILRALAVAILSASSSRPARR